MSITSNSTTSGPAKDTFLVDSGSIPSRGIDIYQDDPAEVSTTTTKSSDRAEPLSIKADPLRADTRKFTVQEFIGCHVPGHPFECSLLQFGSGRHSSKSIDDPVKRIVVATLKTCGAIIKKKIDFQLGTKCKTLFLEHLTRPKEEVKTQAPHDYEWHLNENPVQVLEESWDEILNAAVLRDGEASHEQICRDHGSRGYLDSETNTTISKAVVDLCEELVPSAVASLRVEQYDRLREEAQQELRDAQAHRKRISLFNDEVLARYEADKANRAAQEEERAALSPRVRALRTSERLQSVLEDRFPGRPGIEPEASTSVLDDGLFGFFPLHQAVPDTYGNPPMPTQAPYAEMEQTLRMNSRARYDGLVLDQLTASKTRTALSPTVGSKRAYPIDNGPVRKGHGKEDKYAIARTPDNKRRKVDTTMGEHGSSTQIQPTMKRAATLNTAEEEATEYKPAEASSTLATNAGTLLKAPTGREKWQRITKTSSGSIPTGISKRQLKRAHDIKQEENDKVMASPSAKRQRYDSPEDQTPSATNFKKSRTMGPRTMAGLHKTTRKRPAVLSSPESQQTLSVPKIRSHSAHKSDTDDELAGPDIKKGE
ncbi:MAG: hypothetical protein Q9222_000411 [Ikaeria aurantiellina]